MTSSHWALGEPDGPLACGAVARGRGRGRESIRSQLRDQVSEMPAHASAAQKRQTAQH
jgi:hypothetical protein